MSSVSDVTLVNSFSVVCGPPELSADVFVAILEQQDGRLVDFDGPVLSCRRAGVINVGLMDTNTQRRRDAMISRPVDQRVLISVY